MKVSTPEQTQALKRRLGWIDHKGKEMSWADYVKPAGFYKDDDEEKPKRKFDKKSRPTQRGPITPRR